MCHANSASPHTCTCMSTGKDQPASGICSQSSRCFSGWTIKFFVDYLLQCNIYTVDMDKVEEVVIDSDGVFKYILIELTEKVKKRKRNGAGAHGGSLRNMTIVRGFKWAEFHGKLSRFIPDLVDILVCVYILLADKGPIFHIEAHC